MFVYHSASTYQHNLMCVLPGHRVEFLGSLKDEALAKRLCVLLNQHGLVDCDTSSLHDALLDLERRKP